MAIPIRVELHSPWHAIKTINRLMQKGIIMAANAEAMMNKVLRFPEQCADNLNDLSVELTEFIIKEKK